MRIAELEKCTYQLLAEKQRWQEQDMRQLSEILQLKNATKMLRRKNNSLVLQESKHDRERQHLIDQRATLSDRVAAQESSIAHLKRGLEEKRLELQKLHTIIARSRSESDAFDDLHFTMAFGTLQANIQSTVLGHFGAILVKSELEALNSVNKDDDRDLFLQSYLAELLAKGYISRDAGVFGLERDAEDSQGTFEAQLHKHKGMRKYTLRNSWLTAISSFKRRDHKLEDSDYQGWQKTKQPCLQRLNP